MLDKRKIIRARKDIKIVLAAILTFQLFICVNCGAEQNNSVKRDALYNIQGHDKWFAGDKVKHLTASMLLAAIAYSSVNAGANEESKAVITGVSIPIGIGLLKEFKDLRDGKFWSNKDLVWDVIGAGIAVTIASQID